MPLIVPGISPASKKHEEEKKREEDEKPQPHHFQARPGPVVPEDKSVFESKPSREEQEAKMRALNK